MAPQRISRSPTSKRATKSYSVKRKFLTLAWRRSMFSTKSTLVHSLMSSLPEVAAAGVVAALEAAVARGAAAVEAAGAAAEVVAAEALEAASPALGW